VAVPISDSFWRDLSQGAYPQFEQGRLMSAFTFAEAWSSWERHPAGEELVLLVSGSATIVLEEQGARREVALSQPGEFVLVPRNVWHTATTAVRTTMLFLTPGAGTEHRPA
jgi:mannose-6-phosphate isomerase-like protein (cupin superfamily)